MAEDVEIDAGVTAHVGGGADEQDGWLETTLHQRPGDHEAITANIPVFGEVKAGKVVYAYDTDMKKGGETRMKDAKAKK